jgi:hypothetical protein
MAMQGCSTARELPHGFAVVSVGTTPDLLGRADVVRRSGATIH